MNGRKMERNFKKETSLRLPFPEFENCFGQMTQITTSIPINAHTPLGGGFS